MRGPRKIIQDQAFIGPSKISFGNMIDEMDMDTIQVSRHVAGVDEPGSAEQRAVGTGQFVNNMMAGD